MEIASGNSSAGQILKTLAPQKAIFIFSVILTERGYLNLGLNLDI